MLQELSVDGCSLQTLNDSLLLPVPSPTIGGTSIGTSIGTSENELSPSVRRRHSLITLSAVRCQSLQMCHLGLAPCSNPVGGLLGALNRRGGVARWGGGGRGGELP